MAWEPDYITAAQLAAYQRIGDSVDDVELAVAATAASRAIDNHTNRQFGLVAAPEERRYTARYDYERCRWVLDIDDLMTTVGLVVTVSGTAVTAYTLEPRNAAAEARPWTRLVFGLGAEAVPTASDEYEVTGTARWGWTTVPVPVTQAARLQGSRFASRRDSPYGVAGSPEQGSELRLLARVDADVGVSLRSYVRPRAVG